MTENPTPPEPENTADGYSAAYKAAYEAALAATPHMSAAIVGDEASVQAVEVADSMAAAAASARPTLDDYVKRYDPESTPHPWVKYLRSVPMGGERPPMNHDVHVLNMIAIHLERLGFVEPDPDRSEIKYIPAPFNGDALLSPGQWVDIDEEIEAPKLPDIDLSGVPQDQLEVLEQAIQAEKIRQAKLQTADPAARVDAVAAVPAKTVGVVPVVPEDGSTA